jgi:hypothetical protein
VVVAEQVPELAEPEREEVARSVVRAGRPQVARQWSDTHVAAAAEQALAVRVGVELLLTLVADADSNSGPGERDDRVIVVRPQQEEVP